MLGGRGPSHSLDGKAPALSSKERSSNSGRWPLGVKILKALSSNRTSELSSSAKSSRDLEDFAPFFFLLKGKINEGF